jgi:transcriptional regulator
MVYLPKHFEEPRAARLGALIRRHSFATLVTTGENGVAVSHIPLHYEPARGKHGTLTGHLARPNPQTRHLLAGGAARAIFQGPHAYVSPTWYEGAPNVPTWNYAVVHAHGPVAAFEDEERLSALLAELGSTYEEGPEPWRYEALPDDYRRRMLRGIVGFEVAVERLEGKFKLSQNRDEADRTRVAAALGRSADPVARDLALLMREDQAPAGEATGAQGNS